MKPTPTKHLKDLLEHAGLIAYLKHADGRYIYVNKMYQEVARTPRQKIIGRYDRDIFPEPVARLFMEQDRQVIKKRTPIEFDETIPLPDGVMSFITAKFPLFDDDGKVWAVGAVGTDVTRLKGAQEALRRSEARLQALLANTIEGAMIVDQGWVIRYGSPAFHPILGYHPEEMEGRHIRDFVHTEEMPQVLEGFRRMAATPGAVSPRELRIRHKDGTWRTIEGRATNHLNDPDIEGILINFRDVTARRLAEDHLIESERLYRALVETTNTGYVVVDGKGRVMDANPEYVRLSGHRDLEEIRGRNVVDWTAPHDRQRNAAAVAECFQDGLVRSLEVDYVDRDGEFTPIEINGTVVKMGAQPLIMSICRDITPRRQAQESLRRSEASLQEAELLAGIGSFDCDIPSRKVLRSKGVRRIFGVPAQEFGDQPDAVLKYVHPDDRAYVKEKLFKSLTEGEPFIDDYRIIRPDGSQRIIHAESQVTKDAAGRPLRFFGWLQDITERRALEEKVLQICDRERRNIGHDLHDDLGQQLTGITLLGKALQDRLAAQSSPEAGALAELLRHVDHALARVREMSRGLESVPPRPEGLREALSGLAAHVNSTARIPCRLKDGPHVLVHSQNVADHLFRIAQEAVNNAVRHGSPKAVTIVLEQKDAGLTLTVADDGTGLLEAVKKGSGMGLDIMRHRASLIHGTLTIASHAGKGTQVICRVPATVADEGGGA